MIASGILKSCLMGVLLLLLMISYGNLFPVGIAASPVTHADIPNVTLPHVVRQTMQAYFDKKPKSYAHFAKQWPVPKRYKRQAGLFVTLSLNGKSRACWGSLTPRHADLIQETVYTTLDALTKEYRYPPIKPSEWRSLKPQVSIVNQVEPIRSYRELNPFRDGLLVRSGSRSGIILPKEARDAYYEWVMARMKAGIGAKEPQQLYRLEVTIEE